MVETLHATSQRVTMLRAASLLVSAYYDFPRVRQSVTIPKKVFPQCRNGDYGPSHTLRQASQSLLGKTLFDIRILSSR